MDPNSRGPDDDATLVRVLVATADLIVSGDNDLLMLGTFRHIRIVSSINVLATLPQKP